ncbi:Urocanate reductase precursor [Coriobacteriaceae bacterium CHKCI002]|nr:Urocanate reductase precursor [Coriobacteriaceae bacterium CHKCI002]
MNNDSTHGLSRRSFLKGGVVAGVMATIGLAGCAPASAPTSKDSEGKAVAAEQTSGDWLGEAPTISDDQVTATHEADVIVVGGGTSGMFAACAAVEEGAKCILVEKQSADITGDGIRDTLGAIGSKQQLANDDNPDKFAVINELTRQSNGYGDDRLYRVWADNSGEAIDWYADRLKEAGSEFLHEVDNHEHELRYPIYDVGHSIQWGTVEYSKQYASGVLRDYATGLGLETHYDTALISLIKDGDRVTGIYAQGPDGIVRYNAKNGVIMCTGGYASNTEMMQALQPESEALCCIRKSFPSCVGDGIKACLWAGGVMDDKHTAMIFDRGGIKPDATDASEGQLFWMGSQPFLKVDLEGNRFTNESGSYDHILHASLNLPGQTYCMVWDANYQEDIKRFDTHGCSRLFPHANGTDPVMPMEVIDGMNEGLMADGYIVEADTVEGLAEKLNIPADAFAATVKRYNELADKGEDPDFGKEAFRLSHLDTPPFRGIRMHGGYLICTMDGIKINENMNVIDEQGAPIPGLYCAGDCSGGYFADSYPNLLAGAAAGRSVTFGRRAGQLAAKATA